MPRTRAVHPGFIAALLAATALLGPTAQAQSPAAAPAAPAPATPAPSGDTKAAEAPKAQADEPKPVIEPAALDLLKTMSAKLAAAKTLSVDARGTRERLSTQGQMLSFFTTTHIDVRRPDAFAATVLADGQKLRFIYDGKTFVIADTTTNLFTSVDAPATIDETLNAIAKDKGIHLAVADFLYSDPYAVLTKDITHAYEVQEARVHNAKVKHLAVAGPGIEWQIWIDAETSLPHLLAVTYLDVERHPRFLVELKNWKLDQEIAPPTFAYAPPADAARIEFLPVE